MKRGIGTILMVLVLISNTSTLLANQESETKKVIVENAELFEPIAPMAVDDTIASTFPDANLARIVADEVAGGDVNAILTQGMIDNFTYLFGNGENIQDLTGIEVLSNLEQLILPNNEIASLPESFGNLTSLNTLYLQSNQLTSLPESFGNLSSLDILYLSDNQLANLPESFGNLSSLQTVYLTDNQLTNLPESFFDLSSLKNLYLVNNQLTSLSESFGNLSGLQNVYLENNQLTSLPESFGDLSGLQLLQLANNQLISLPESFGNLSSLWYLELQYNQLTSLPESFGNLSSLESIFLFDNQLTNLPESFGNLSNARYVTLLYNLLPEDYSDILNAIGLNFVFNYEEQRQVMLNTGLSPYIIKSESDLNAIDLFTTVILSDDSSVSTGHKLILENYVDENNAPVDLNDYIQNGIIQKDGKVFAQVRAIGTGLFSNNNDNGITVDKMELNFETTYYNLFFNLNGGTGTTPTTQSMLEGEIGIAVDNPIREGYTFKGWNTMLDGSGTSWDFATNKMSAEDVTLYAQWQAEAKPVNPTDPANPVNSPKTGDASNAIGNSALLLALAGTLLLIGKKRR